MSIRQYTDLILAASASYGVPASLIAGTMEVESGGNQYAVSSAGAIGLMQVMPFHFVSGEDPFDPATNINKGTSILKQGYDRCHNWPSAIAAYFGAISGCSITTASDGSGVDGFGYVAKVQAAQESYRDLDSSNGSVEAPVLDEGLLSFVVIGIILALVLAR